MEMFIKDGKGVGKSAEVNSFQQLETASVSSTGVAFLSKQGKAFAASVPHVTLTTTKGLILYLKNTSVSNESYLFENIFFGFDGGSTNNDKTCKISMAIGVGAPSANNTVSAAGNLNTNSSATATMTVEYWDETSTGMTAVAGQEAFHLTVGRGHICVNVAGSLILAPNQSIGFYADADEIGELSFCLSGYFKDVS